MLGAGLRPRRGVTAEGPRRGKVSINPTQQPVSLTETGCSSFTQTPKNAAGRRDAARSRFSVAMRG